MAFFESDLLKTCPYNRNHKVKPSRYQLHVSKCAKMYGPSVGLRVCPYNVDHRLTEDEFNSHVMSCSAGSQFVRAAVEKEPISAVKLQYKSDADDKYKYVGHQFFTEDNWREEYLNGEEMERCIGVVNNHVLNADAMTAQRLFDMNFGANSDTYSKTVATDQWFLSRMTSEERKKYNQMLVSKMKTEMTETNDNNSNAVEESDAYDEFNHQLGSTINSNANKGRTDPNNNESQLTIGVRRPLSDPFPRLQKRQVRDNGSSSGTQQTSKLGIGRGIGRGSVASVRSVGSVANKK